MPAQTRVIHYYVCLGAAGGKECEVTMEKIKINKIRCKRCGDIIESKTVHDFKFCKCGAVAVDGGKEYLRRCFINTEDDYEELSEYEKTPS